MRKGSVVRFVDPHSVNSPRPPRLFTAGSTALLSLAVAIFVACVGSVLKPLRWEQTLDFYSGHVGGPDFQRHRSVTLANGVLHLQSVQFHAPGRWPIRAVYKAYPLGFPFARSWLGFSLQLEPPGWSTGGGYYHEASFPAWVVAAIAAIPAWRRYRLRRRWYARGEFCSRCRYDLTGNTSGRCPECGTAIESESVPPKLSDIAS